MKMIKRVGLVTLLSVSALFGYSGYYAPFEGTKTITQGWNGSYSHGGKGYAYGLDVGISYKNVLSVKDGEIIYAQDHKYFGKTIIIKHSDGLYSLYAHLSKFKMTNGQVKRGNLIAISGYTGEWKGTGPHLHFQILTEYLGNSEENIRKLSAKKYTTTIDFQGFLASDVYTGTKSVTSKNSLTNSVATIPQSYFSGAGSVIDNRSNEYGGTHDVAIMHPYGSWNSTVVFQWRRDPKSNNCTQLNISSDKDIGDVIIRTKGWSHHTIREAFKVNLDKYSPITIKNNNQQWTTLAITSTQPISEETTIDATCKKSTDRFIDGSRVKVDVSTDNLVDVGAGYSWAGTASIISRITSGTSPFGRTKDWAISFSKNKSFTSFQWDTTNCHTLQIINGKTNSGDDSNENANVVIRKKPWNEKEWDDPICYNLPCTIDESRNGYFLLKVLGNANAIDSGNIEAKCVR